MEQLKRGSRWSKFAPAALAVVLLCCATAPDPDLIHRANREVICIVGPECDAAWGRAVASVYDVCGFKVQTQTDLLIETYGPERFNPRLACRINKVPMGDGRARILIVATCGASTCYPSELVARAALTRDLLAAIEAARGDATKDPGR